MKIPLLLISVLLFLPLKSLSTQESAAKAWDVNAPDFTASATTVDLDLDEGTWMSVDVSPDGQHIVFDLLGNIYLIPVSGGEAELLVGDHSWDIQPRFSPMVVTSPSRLIVTEVIISGRFHWKANSSNRSLLKILDY